MCDARLRLNCGQHFRQRFVAAESAAPTHRTRQIVAGAERKERNGRIRGPAELVKRGQHPTDGAIPAAHENAHGRVNL